MRLVKRLPLLLVTLLFIAFICWFLYYDLQYITIHGKITCKDVRNLYIPFPANVEKVHIHEGDLVDSGTQLLTINVDDINLRRKQIEFEIARARNEIKIRQTELAQLKSDLHYSQQMHQRYTDLLKREDFLVQNGATAPVKMEYFKDTLNLYSKTRHDLNTRIAAEMGSYATLNLLNHKILMLEDELRNIDSHFRINAIDENVLLSPVKHGAICSVNVSQGDITRSEKPVMTILNLDSIVIIGQVPEKVIRYIQQGSYVKIVPKTNFWQRLKGTVLKKSEIAFQEQGITFFRIEVKIESQGKYLLPNSNVILKIHRKFNITNLFAL